MLNAILTAPVRLVEISVDGGTKKQYEESRVGGSFDRLVMNLKRLKEVRDRHHAPTFINLRVMLRPSQQDYENALLTFWRPLADCVMRQYVIKRKELDNDADVYENVQRKLGEYPKCSLPFKDLDITWSGDVPVCHYSAAQVGEPGLILGNISRDTLLSLWNSPTMKQYREAHRHRNEAKMPICSGCSAS